MGWRAVDGPSDVEPGEMWRATPPAIPTPEVVEQPPQLTPAQITKLADFLKTNPDIAEAFGL